MEAFIKIIQSVKSNHVNINPTEIYNEGWMTRLLVYYSIQEGIKLPFLDFSKVNNWTSEALISSPFVKASKYREGYTHADMVLGDFDVNYEKRGEVHVTPEPKVFGIIEAKMGSNLSSGTKHVSKYNQASRNIACIAHNTYKWDCDIFFAVVAPEKKIVDHKIESQIETKFIRQQIEDRYSLYNSDDDVLNNYKSIMKKVEQCRISTLSYEAWIDLFDTREVKSHLQDFYCNALKWNRIK